MRSEWLCLSKILHQVLLWSTLFVFAVIVEITAVLFDPHTFGQWSGYDFVIFTTLQLFPPPQKKYCPFAHHFCPCFLLCNIKEKVDSAFYLHIRMKFQWLFRMILWMYHTVRSHGLVAFHSKAYFQLIVFTNNLWNGGVRESRYSRE